MKTNIVQDYKVFEGPYNTQMPQLVKENYNTLTTKEVMQYKIKAIQSKNKEEIDFWLEHNYWDTKTGLDYHNNQLIIIPNSELLLNIREDSKLNNGSLILSKEQYNKRSKEYEVIKRNKIIFDKSLTKTQAKNHPIWQKLAEEDKALLNEYVDLIFSEAKSRRNYDKNMGIYLPEDQKNPAPAERFFRLGDLGNMWHQYQRSNANAMCGLYDDTCLFGWHKENLDQLLSKTSKKDKIKNPQELKFENSTKLV